MRVVFRIVFRVNDYPDIVVLVFKIKEGLLLVTQYYDDVVDSRSFDLLNLPLYKDFPFNFKKPFRFLKRERDETLGHSRSHYDGVTDLVRRQRLQTGFCNARVVDISRCSKRGHKL